MKYRIVLILIFLSIQSCTSTNYEDLKKITFTDKNESFSIEVPKSWNIEEVNEDDYSDVTISSTGDYNIQLIITSRFLDEREKELELLNLIDRMLNVSVEQLEYNDCTIINVGNAKEFKTGYPVFVITAITKSGKNLITQWGTVVNARNFSFTMTTTNKEHSEEISNITRELMESVEILD